MSQGGDQGGGRPGEGTRRVEPGRGPWGGTRAEGTRVDGIRGEGASGWKP